MSAGILAPIRFTVLLANILAVSESYPRLSANVDLTVPILRTDSDFEAELKNAKILLALHLAMATFELIGQTCGLTFFQSIQATISIACHLIAVILLWVFTVMPLQTDVLYITLFVFMLPPFLIECWLWLFTFCYKRLK